MASKRIELSVTAISWIPSEAIAGLSKVPFEMGVTHYDEPPPDQLEDLEELRRTDRFREANELRAFIEVEDGRIVGHGHLGQGHIGATTVRVGRGRHPVPGGPPARHPAGAGGDARLGAVRPDRGRPDGPADATARPPQAVRAVLAVDRVDDARADAQRRWLVEPRAGRRQPVPTPLDLRQRRAARREVGRVDFTTWFNDSFGDRTPWGTSDSPARRGQRRVEPRAAAVGEHHAWRPEAEDPHDRGRQHAPRAGRPRARTCS